jgi:predicted Zn-dependent protease
MRASTNIDTQAQKHNENLEKAKRREKLATDTDRIKRGAGEAFFDMGFLDVRANVEKIARAIDELKERSEEKTEAEWQSLLARANTLKQKTQRSQGK